MARSFVLHCDSCGKQESSRVKVQTVRVIFEDQTYFGDLCEGCAGRMVMSNHLQQKAIRRRKFEVVDDSTIEGTMEELTKTFLAYDKPRGRKVKVKP